MVFVWPKEIYNVRFCILFLNFNSADYFVKAYQKLRTVEPSISNSKHIQHGKLSIILCFLYKWLHSGFG